MPASFRTWRTQSTRLPFRIAIEQDGRVLFAVRAQSAWPAPGGQIFCLPEREHDPVEHLELVESVPVAAMNRLGPRLLVSLDRPGRKRCEFLFLKKRRADGTPYQQVFFRTEGAVRAHRTSGRSELWTDRELDVAIDARERYPWRFPSARVQRRALATGDYALLRDERPIAVVERKTFENLLGDFGTIRAFHQSLAQLASQPRAALVVESHYGDFLDPERTHPWPAAHAARLLAEISALHPRLPIVFAGNRKLANQWALRWFTAVAADVAELPLFVSEAIAAYEPPAESALDDEIRAAVLTRLGRCFRAAEVAQVVPRADAKRITRLLRTLREEGRLQRVGHGRGAHWQRSDVD
ncbi:MAG: hypothetical protein DCC71_02660 [Proteobacteria bacterium]|nr:MAG: hypothetical protein DCC71_02660 [Pseudomonadota bacterium]